VEEAVSLRCTLLHTEFTLLFLSGMKFLGRSVSRAISQKSFRLVSARPGGTAVDIEPGAVFNRKSSSITYPPGTSNPPLRSPTSDDAEAFFGLMGYREGSLIRDSETLERYNIDWTVSFLFLAIF